MKQPIKPYNPEDYKGKIYGNLMMIEPIGDIKTKHKQIWKCKCILCGNEVIKRFESIVYLITTHCVKCKNNQNSYLNHIVGNMTVIDITNYRRNRRIVWKLKCNVCGKIHYADSALIRRYYLKEYSSFKCKHKEPDKEHYWFAHKPYTIIKSVQLKPKA